MRKAFNSISNFMYGFLAYFTFILIFISVILIAYSILYNQDKVINFCLTAVSSAYIYKTLKGGE